MTIRYRRRHGSRDQTFRLHLVTREGVGIVGLEAADCRAHFVRDSDAAPKAFDAALREIDVETLPGVYDLPIPDSCFAEGSSAVTFVVEAGGSTTAIYLELVGYDPYDEFALDLENFVRSTCHSHLSSAFYRVMPPTIRPMMELLRDGAELE